MHDRCERGWPRFVIMALAGIAVAGLVVMWLWNWLAPALLGLKEIQFLQALGLLVLTRLLFGGFRGHTHIRDHWRRHMEERWQTMSPEEREKFQHGMRSCWGRRKPDDTSGTD